MKKLNALFATTQRKITTAAIGAVVVCPMLANAADGDIDITKALLYFGGAVVAAGSLIGVSMGLAALIGAGKQAKSAAR